MSDPAVQEGEDSCFCSRGNSYLFGPTYSRFLHFRSQSCRVLASVRVPPLQVREGRSALRKG